MSVLRQAGAILAAAIVTVVIMLVAAAFGAALAVFMIYLGPYGGIR
ncbi:MAG TPA: hypothetical protein VEY08_16170 [Chloroflexia bacterium]|nr:hypothetical protein [Chloroflexia bacterium]